MDKLKQGDKIQIEITSFGSNGEGVGKYGDCTVFVDFALPGEVVTARVTYVKKQVAFATTVSVEVASARRVAAKCRLFGKCGGCDLQHVDFDSENEFKHQIVQKNFKKIAGVDVDVLPTFSGERFGYRNKLSLPIRGKRGDVKIGMYKKQSHAVIEVRHCALSPWADDVVAIVKAFLDESGAVPYDEKTFHGLVRHLVARYTQGQLLVTLVCTEKPSFSLDALYRALKEKFDKVGLFVNVNRLQNNVILGDETIRVCGVDHIVGVENGVKFHLRPDSFFQVNDEVKTAIYADVKQRLTLDGVDAVIDCFSGVGLLTASLVSPNYDVYAIEIVPSATRDADEMKKANGIVNLTNICGDVNEELPKLLRKLEGKKVAVVVDPPRKGLGEEVCRLLSSSAPAQIVYVSCDSATLARDVAYLSGAYSIKYCRPYNMFPATRHVETLCLLEK